MKMNLRKVLREDAWRIIEKKETSNIDFFSFVILLLLDKDKMKLQQVWKQAKKLKSEYNNILEEVENAIIEGNGEVLKALEKLMKKYDQKITPLIREIKSLHEN